MPTAGHPDTQGVLYLPEDLSCHFQDFRSSLKIPFTGQAKSTGESRQLLLSLIPSAFLRASFLTMKCLVGAFFL